MHRQALAAIDGISGAGGRANIVVPALLDTSDLARRDRALVTRSWRTGRSATQRACDRLVDAAPCAGRPRRRLEPRCAWGAYQLASSCGRRPHAAVSATVAEMAGTRARGLVNAVLRRVAHDVKAGVAWPSDAVRMSYPDWIIGRAVARRSGPDQAYAALEQMNLAASITTRDDGYIQDLASQWAAAAVGTGPGERVADLCAAPGGKATFLASGDAGPSIVVAGDLDGRRAFRQVAENAGRAGPGQRGDRGRWTAAARRSGRGYVRPGPGRCAVLGPRRPRAAGPTPVGGSSRAMSAGWWGCSSACSTPRVALVRPGGRVVYSVCTLTRAETTGIDDWLASAHPEARAIDLDLDPAWQRVGRGARLLPQAAGTDGMFLLAVQAPGPDSSPVSP